MAFWGFDPSTVLGQPTVDNGDVINKDKFWCATEVDENDQMVKSGVCKEMCSNGKV